MASEEWNIDLIGQKISHKTLAFSIQFEGDPTSNDCEGKPSRFPDELSALQKVRLLREAYDAYIAAYEAERPPSRSFGYNAKPSSARHNAPPAPSRAESAAAKAVSAKPKLSLKRTEKPAS